jgi:hypothetical protein
VIEETEQLKRIKDEAVFREKYQEGLTKLT